MLSDNEYKYKFSIIMSIYNVEEYLREAVDSIINQNIGFEENVQLILVNDGSPDNSEEICLEYKEKYPNNVVYVKKENGGLSSAKNYGLKYREGQYVNFFDPDDILPPKVLKEVEKFFNKNNNIISMVGIPLVFFEARTGLHPKYKYMGNKNRIINLDIEPYNFILSSASVFYKTEVFNEVQFDEEMVGEEDTKLNFRIYEKDHCFGYVCEKGVRYNYRKRVEGGSIVDKSSTNKANFYSVIRLLDEVIENNDENNIPNYKKELIIYETRSRLKSLDEKMFEKEEYEYIISKYREYVNLVGDAYLATSSRWLPDLQGKYFYLCNFLQNNQTFKISDNGFIRYKDFNLSPVNQMRLLIQNIKFTKKNIVIDLFFWDYNIENLELIVKTSDGKIREFCNIDRVDSLGYNIKYGNNIVSNVIHYKLKLKHKRQAISFYIRNKDNNVEYRVENIDINKYNKLILKNKEIRIFYNDYNIKFKNNEITIKKFKYPSLKYSYHTYLCIKKEYKYKAFYRLLNRRKKKYILINDRPEKAGDNGEAIFKYINKNENELAKNTYFVISKKCKDYKRLKKYGNVVALNSIKHKLLFLNCKLIMSSHMHIPFYSAFENKDLKFYRDMLNYKFVWLQHGITQNDISSAANKYAKGIDYVVLATKAEKEEFGKSKYFYNEKDLILSGFSRYDNLKDDSKNIITIAPTWRSYLSGEIESDGFHAIKDGFEESQYYCKYTNILKNEDLLNILRNKGIKINFVLHPGMAGYEEMFRKYENDVVNIISAHKVNYSKVFAESNLLITDYSSVFFDFAYLKKPIIYYQFDKERFFTEHYKSGYFHYDEDGFGDVIEEENEIFDKILYYINNGFKIEDKYLNRINSTFIYTDRNNCRRLIEYLKDKNVIK